MISLPKAKKAFEAFIRQFDTTDPKIALKIRHTYGVMDACDFLAKEMHLSETDHQLALLIGLLHDIGRFEQLTRFNSYDDNLLSHAQCGLEVLFGVEAANNPAIFMEKKNHTDTQNIAGKNTVSINDTATFPAGNIRAFIETDAYDEIIYHAIKNHSEFKIDPNLSGQMLLHAQIIRDADKLDNFRVKTEDSIPAMLDVTEEELGQEAVTDAIFQCFYDHRLILKSDRKTHMDMWISYLAFIFDFNFSASFKFVLEHDYISKNIDRIPYTNPDTARKMAQIKEIASSYCQEKAI